MTLDYLLWMQNQDPEKRKKHLETQDRLKSEAMEEEKKRLEAEEKLERTKIDNWLALTPFEKLDIVLKYFSGEIYPYIILEHQIIEYLDGQNYKCPPGAGENELRQVLNKLFEDKYIYRKEESAGEGSQINVSYYPKFDGNFFISQGGYSQRETDLINNRIHLKYAEERLRKHDFWLRAGGIGAAIGAIFLLIWDISKFLISEKVAPMALSEVCFYLILFPTFFLIMWCIVKKLPS